MSFDFSPNVNLSNVQASHKSSDGGGGNTGYFQRGNSEEDTQYIFKDNNETDSFTLSVTVDVDEDETSLVDSIKQFFVGLIKKIKKILNIK